MGKYHNNYALIFLPCLGCVYSGFDSNSMEILSLVIPQQIQSSYFSSEPQDSTDFHEKLIIVTKF